MQELSVALEAAQAGANVLLEYFGKADLQVQEKGTADLVTEADVTSERVLVEGIRSAFPDHAVLGEESHHDEINSEHLWIVDPLDGTTNFTHGIPHYAVSIAYWHRGRPVCGVVLNPSRGDLFTATAGSGAFHNGRRISVTPAQTLSEVLVGVGFYYDRGAMMEATLGAVGDLFRQQIRGIRRMGTASLDLCQVALGCYGSFFEFQLSPWDFAAGMLILQEAGGTITDCFGGDLPLKTTTVCGTNGHLHPQMLNLLAPHAQSLRQ